MTVNKSEPWSMKPRLMYRFTPTEYYYTQQPRQLYCIFEQRYVTTRTTVHMYVNTREDLLLTSCYKRVYYHLLSSYVCATYDAKYLLIHNVFSILQHKYISFMSLYCVATSSPLYIM